MFWACVLLPFDRMALCTISRRHDHMDPVAVVEKGVLVRIRVRRVAFRASNGHEPCPAPDLVDRCQGDATLLGRPLQGHLDRVRGVAASPPVMGDPGAEQAVTGETLFRGFAQGGAALCRNVLQRRKGEAKPCKEKEQSDSAGHLCFLLGCVACGTSPLTSLGEGTRLSESFSRGLG